MTDDGADKLVIYQVGSHGDMTPVPGTPIPLGAGAHDPTSVTFSPNGRLLATATIDPISVSMFSVPTDSTVPVPVKGSPFLNGVGPNEEFEQLRRVLQRGRPHTRRHHNRYHGLSPQLDRQGTRRRFRKFGPGDNSSIVTHYVIDVQPSSGESFRTELREPVTAGAFHAPIVGEVVKLKCDPARKKARFDLSDKSGQLDREAAALLAQGEREDKEDRARFPPS